MQQELVKMMDAPGIEAVYGHVEGDDGVVCLFKGGGLPLSQEQKDRWRGMFDATRLVLKASLAQDPSLAEIRVTLERHTVLMRRQLNRDVGVIFVKGDPVVKSLPRMIRKTFRRLEASPRRDQTAAPPLPAPRVLGGGVPSDAGASFHDTPRPK